MNKRLLILDIDGTLTNSNKEITSATRAAVMSLMERGHGCMLASGRPLYGMLWAARELEFQRYGGYLLSYNGAKIIQFDTMETIYEKRVKKEYLPVLYEFALKHDCGIISYRGDDIISGNGMNEYIELEGRINEMDIREVDNFPDYFREDVIKCMLCASPDKTKALEGELKALIGQSVSVYRSEPFYVEAMPLGVDKASSIAHTLPLVGFSREDCVACGDGYNDMGMLQYAGLGVAMGNARQEVKDIADVITGSNDEDGLVPVIEKYFK